MGQMCTFGGRARALALVVALVLVGAGEVCADEIRLRRSAVVAAGEAITLGVIADLDGTYAQQLRSIVVHKGGATGTWATLELDTVREALQRDGARLGALSMSGRQCAVRIGEAPMPAPVQAVPTDVSIWVEYDVASVTGVPEVRSMVAASVAEQLGLGDHDRLRLQFDAALDEAMTASAGRRLSVEAKSAVSGGAVLMGLTAYDIEGGVVGTWVIRVQAQVWRTGVRMVRTVNRAGTLTMGDAEPVSTWIDAGDAVIAAMDEAVGREARMRLEAGEWIRSGQLELPIAVKRGDLVQVHCLSGGLAVRARGRALAQGRVGETIECRLEASERSFLARVDAPGRVVMHASATNQNQAEDE